MRRILAAVLFGASACTASPIDVANIQQATWNQSQGPCIGVDNESGGADMTCCASGSPAQDDVTGIIICNVAGNLPGQGPGVDWPWAPGGPGAPGGVNPPPPEDDQPDCDTVLPPTWNTYNLTPTGGKTATLADGTVIDLDTKTGVLTDRPMTKKVVIVNDGLKDQKNLAPIYLPAKASGALVDMTTGRSWEVKDGFLRDAERSHDWVFMGGAIVDPIVWDVVYPEDLWVVNLAGPSGRAFAHDKETVVPVFGFTPGGLFGKLVVPTAGQLYGHWHDANCPNAAEEKRKDCVEECSYDAGQSHLQCREQYWDPYPCGNVHCPPPEFRICKDAVREEYNECAEWCNAYPW